VEDTWRILVLANETLAGPRLQEVIVRLAEGVAEDVLVVCPVMPAGTLSEGPTEDSTSATAKARLQAAVAALRAVGVEARGELGDSDPVVALAAALEGFSADEIVISSHAAGRSPWLEQDIVAAAGATFDGPVTHVVGD
jgi:predicted TIM-barrel enzyme